MKNIETPDKMHLTKLIEELRYGRFVIPDFQREFKWQPSDVNELLKSVFEDYYIGTLLLWRASLDNLNKLSCEPIYGFKQKIDPYHIVLDGQQRLSALYYAFFAPDINFPNRKNRYIFYVDIPELLNQNFEDAFRYEWLPNRVSKFFNGWEWQHENKVFPLYIFGGKQKKFYKWLDEYESFWKAKNYDGYHTEREKIEQFFEDNRSNYEVSYIELDRDIEIGKVCDIFTRINNTGVRLSIFDLLNALARPRNIKLKEMWRNVSEDFEPFLFNNTQVQVLQTMSILLQKYCAPKYLYYLVPNETKVIKLSDGTKKEIVLLQSREDFIEQWNLAVKEILKSLKILTNPRGFGIIHQKFFPYPTMLPIFTALQIEKNKAEYQEKRNLSDKINQWYWASLFTKNYSSSVESQMTQDYIQMKRWFKDDSEIPKVIEQFKNEIDNLYLENEQRAGSAIYKAIFNILVKKGARDWNTFDLPEYSELEDHHIVPKSWGNKYKIKEINSILNRTPISDETNKKVIGNKLPNEYLRDIFKNSNNDKEIYDLLKTHLISRKSVEILLRKPFTSEDFYQFLEERKKSILSEIKKVINTFYE